MHRLETHVSEMLPIGRIRYPRPIFSQRSLYPMPGTFWTVAVLRNRKEGSIVQGAVLWGFKKANLNERSINIRSYASNHQSIS